MKRTWKAAALTWRLSGEAAENSEKSRYTIFGPRIEPGT